MLWLDAPPQQLSTPVRYRCGSAVHVPQRTAADRPRRRTTATAAQCGSPRAARDIDAGTRIDALDGLIDGRKASSLAAVRDAAPVRFHGDFAADNLLLRNASLAAVIDFGCCGVDDPAGDLTIA